MSSFDVKVRRLTILPHSNADALEIAQIDAYQAIVPKGQFQTGDLAVYIPEAAIVPHWLLEEMGLVGKLAGPEANRVKAMKLRGVLSQGLVWRPAASPPLTEGNDWAAVLGITKWEPPIPTELAGEVEGAPDSSLFRSYTDIENIKKWPNIFEPGEQVIMTEKLHGSCCIVGLINGQRIVTSKGLAERHLVIVESPRNAYWRVAQQEQLFEKLERVLQSAGLAEGLLFGEVLGVQDLMYGLTKGQLGYRAFDVLSAFGWNQALDQVLPQAGIPIVPTLYRGPYSLEALTEHTSGKSTLAGHLREGVVVRPTHEREHPELGRVILKSISPDYLTRKGGTEAN